MEWLHAIERRRAVWFNTHLPSISSRAKAIGSCRRSVCTSETRAHSHRTGNAHNLAMRFLWPKIRNFRLLIRCGSRRTHPINIMIVREHLIVSLVCGTLLLPFGWPWSAGHGMPFKLGDDVVTGKFWAFYYYNIRFWLVNFFFSVRIVCARSFSRFLSILGELPVSFEDRITFIYLFLIKFEPLLRWLAINFQRSHYSFPYFYQLSPFVWHCKTATAAQRWRRVSQSMEMVPFHYLSATRKVN